MTHDWKLVMVAAAAVGLAACNNDPPRNNGDESTADGGRGDAEHSGDIGPGTGPDGAMAVALPTRGEPRPIWEAPTPEA